MSGDRADRLLAALLTAHCPALRTKLSWHAMRIYLACALLASKASHSQIQALCRWQSEESLLIYARLNMADYGLLLNQAFTADVNSARTTSLAAGLPCLDAREALAPLANLDVEDLEQALQETHWYQLEPPPLSPATRIRSQGSRPCRPTRESDRRVHPSALP